MKYLFHPEAETELAQAIEYYEEYEEGLRCDFATPAAGADGVSAAAEFNR